MAKSLAGVLAAFGGVVGAGMLLAGMLIGLGGCVNDKPSEGSIVKVGDPLPSFRVVLNDSTAVSAADFTGRGGLICFFNTGCTDCRMEFPALQGAYERYREMYADDADRPIFLLVARAQTDPDIAAYWSMQGFTMPYAPQTDRAVFELFADSGIPRIYIIGRDGRIRRLYGETSRPSAADLIADLAEI